MTEREKSLEKLWTWPARMVGAVYHVVGEDVAVDTRMLRRMPAGRFLPWLVLVVVLVLPLLGLRTYTNVYTESALLMATGLLSGAIGSSLGVLFVAGHVIFDLSTEIGAKVVALDLSFPALASLLARVISYLLLWVLVIEIPAAGYAAKEGLAQLVQGRGISQTSRQFSVLTILATPCFGVFLVYIWALGMPFFIRTVAWWGGQHVPRQAIEPLQVGWALAAGAFGALLVGSLVQTAWRETERELVSEPVASGGRPWRPSWGNVLGSLLAALIISGLATSFFEFGLLLAALICSGPLTRAVLSRYPPIRSARDRLPFGVRFLVACAASFFLIWPAMEFWYWLNSGFVVSYFPVVLATAVGISIFSLLLTESKGGHVDE